MNVLPNLRIVRSEDVLPHEIADAIREARIEERLREDGLLRDPLIAGSLRDGGYVLLDGTNRKRALASLGLPYLLVQLVNYADTGAVELRTWAHEVRLPIGKVLEHAAQIPDLSVSPLHSDGAKDALHEPQTIAVLQSKSETWWLLREDGETRRARQLRLLVDTYEPYMRRVEAAARRPEEQAAITAPDTTLVEFPIFAREDVTRAAVERDLIPAGITRHILRAGRALRVNLPLEMLSRKYDAPGANENLGRHLGKLEPRLYQEPTVLYDS